MRAALLLVALFLGACRAPSPPPALGERGSCTRLEATRVVRGRALCENVWACVRPPGGPMDRVGLRRIARCDAAPGPVVLYLPGMHMNAELLSVSPAADLRLYLAEAGFRVWGLDYRTHAVPPDAPPDELNALAAWTADTFVEDATWALGFVATNDPGPTFLAGFSYGGGLAYRVVSRGSHPGGLVILDGVAGGGTAGPTAIDVGSTRLPYDRREQLLRQAERGADGSSAGATLADVLYTAASFGGQGGLSNAKNGVSDVRVVAELLATYDRWWPGAALAAAPPPPPRQPLPVLAFASTRMGPAWTERVRASARAFGGDAAVVKVLPEYGHLDVLVGTHAPRDVYEPARAWMEERAGGR